MTRARLPWRGGAYDLSATLNSGQAFRWRQCGNTWEGVVGRRWVSLRQGKDAIQAQTAETVPDWDWLAQYLQTGLDLDAVIRSFPDDPALRAAARECRGLRLLRQNPWECLASFLLSSTKQIVQIRQIVQRLCVAWGDPVAAPPGAPPAFAFPSPSRLASCAESELRACRMGFRAPHLLAAARAVSGGVFDLEALACAPLETARAKLRRLPGVGPKIADCVLLFAYEFPAAFPVDVWVRRALGAAYFDGHAPGARQLEAFAASHFGPNAGYAQQYLFHHARMRSPRARRDGGAVLRSSRHTAHRRASSAADPPRDR